MVEILKTRYGDPGKVADSVIGEIQRVKKSEESDCNKLIHFINLLDTGYRDLKNLNGIDMLIELESYRPVYRIRMG